MNPKSFTEQLDAPARRFDYGDETVLVADLGVSDDAVTIDVVDETVILVVEADDETRQHEFDVPAGTVAKALINNGVVTVEVER
ncbi:uncharacterized protein HHUB_2817 [Halobacterium hubeiense]|uniref:Hsp20/alpha crystallin family protein n=2 Tax=Halobacterium TaxID=2239 RepID=A0A0U5H454_9EURY|nr:hypothetical protein [Halobacterium hubeiense]CQH58746.1 uncharacterized protein HHUB_2817 [Halobacterium hubeiense]